MTLVSMSRIGPSFWVLPIQRAHLKNPYHQIGPASRCKAALTVGEISIEVVLGASISCPDIHFHTRKAVIHICNPNVNIQKT
jgi:hypothetical protein